MKKLRKLLVVVIVVSMMTTYAQIPSANAASLKNVRDTLSTSAPASLATHVIGFTTNIELDVLGYIEVELPDSFGNIVGTAGISCPGTGATPTDESTEVARCTYDSALASSTPYTFTLAGITNPPTGFYNVEIRTYLSGGALQESSIVIVAIVDTVTVTAHVDSTLSFTVNGLNEGALVNGDTTTGTTTASSTPFGDLTSARGQIILGQELKVTTNASAGFQVTVTQNKNFDTAAGAIIDSFVNGTATTTPIAWGTLTPNLDLPNTWGHFGFSTDDDDGVGGVTSYADSTYTGLAVSSSTVIMAHNGPSSATAEDKGLTRVAYSVEINDLQEAGDYDTTMTYICTPTF